MESKTDAPELLAELDALFAKATPGDWFLLEQPWLPKGVDTSIQAGSPDPHNATFICDFDEWAADEDERNPRAWSDAQLLVALHNAWPKLRALLAAPSPVSKPYLCDGTKFKLTFN